MATYSEILFYWFLKASPEPAYIRERMPLWFGGLSSNDDVIRSRFESDVTRAKNGELSDWGDTAKGRLGLILLLDQFTRMLHRGSPLAFACDALAQKVCLEGLEKGQDQRLQPIERLFFYLPLEHAEDMDLQNRCVTLLETMGKAVLPEHKEVFDSFVDYGERHRDVIRRFGRFPHRNQTLGRESTPEELVYLKQPGAGF